MRDRAVRSADAELTRHFFRRFFENDVLQPDGETTTTVARALGAVAAPGLMFAFFLQNAYPRRSAWGRIEDQYFFVLFSFVTMAGVALFEWEMLFPERLDFFVLSPLPLRAAQLLRAKATALGALLGVFLLAANATGIFMLPIVSKGVFWRMVWAQSVAVGLAGLFGAVAVMVTGGVFLCVLPQGAFRRVSPVLQMLATAALALLVIQYARSGDQIEAILRRPGPVVQWVPTVWFLGVFQRVLHGQAAEAFAAGAARRAWEATGIVLGLALLLYPLAWVRMQRMAVQGEPMRNRQPLRWWGRMQEALVRRPGERAIFSFISKTMLRNSKYQVYLALYCGVGLALSAACAFAFQSRRGALQLAVSPLGLRAVLPLLLFWMIAGLHMAFAFPQSLSARWVFRVTGVDLQGCARATRHWVGGCGAAGIGVWLFVLGVAGWGWRPLLVQAMWGVCFASFLVKGFFLAQRGAPFTRPRAPGKTSLPAVLTLYLGLLPLTLFGMVWAEVFAERRLGELLWPVFALALFSFFVLWAREHLVWKGDEGEGPDGEIQLLGLTGDLRA